MYIYIVSIVDPYISRYYFELQRRNYVTPTSYLGLILTFKELLSKKQEDLLMQRNRYVVSKNCIFCLFKLFQITSLHSILIMLKLNLNSFSAFNK